jgi:hypothetical protein
MSLRYKPALLNISFTINQTMHDFDFLTVIMLSHCYLIEMNRKSIKI